MNVCVWASTQSTKMETSTVQTEGKLGERIKQSECASVVRRCPTPSPATNLVCQSPEELDSRPTTVTPRFILVLAVAMFHTDWDPPGWPSDATGEFLSEIISCSRGKCACVWPCIYMSVAVFLLASLKAQNLFPYICVAFYLCDLWPTLLSS